MKFHSLALAFIGAVTATPVPSTGLETTALEHRQIGGSDTSNDLVNGACKAVTFIFARGSTESGNMGTIVGPGVCSDLKSTLGAGNVACQGVGSPYDATIADNFLPQNTSPKDIGAATTLFNLASSKCPNTSIVAGGYSQGTAVIDGSVQQLSASVKAKVKGVVLFGFTRNLQDGGRIPNYPTADTDVFCAVGDLVCDGTMEITLAHLSYGVDAPAAAAFLASKVK